MQKWSAWLLQWLELLFDANAAEEKGWKDWVRLANWEVVVFVFVFLVSSPSTSSLLAGKSGGGRSLDAVCVS